jgi:hypothetical protein
MVTRITDLPSARGARRPRFTSAGAAALVAAFTLGAAIIALAVGAPARDGDPSDSPAAPAPAAAPVVEPITVYLTASVEEAMEFQRGLAMLTPGGLTGNENVLAAGTPDESDRAWALVRTLEVERGAGGVRVIDLRRPGAVPATTSTPPCDATPTDRPTFGAC